MNAMLKSLPDDAAFGSAAPGGFYAGRISIAGVAYALIVAPKAPGEHKDTVWNGSLKRVDGAVSYFDGLANTRAMADAGSKVGAWAIFLAGDGCSDFYLP